MKDMVVTFSALKEYVLKLEKRIESLELYRRSIHDWIKAGLFKDKPTFVAFNSDILMSQATGEVKYKEKPKDSEFESIGDKLKTFPEQIERLKSEVKTEEIQKTGWKEKYDDKDKEIESLKSELEKSTQHCPSCGIEYWKNHTLYELSVKQQKIIEQALEKNSKLSPTINRREMKDILEGSK